MGLQVQASYRHGLALGTPIYTFPAGTPTLQLPWVNSLFVYSYSTFTVKKKNHQGKCEILTKICILISKLVPAG